MVKRISVNPLILQWAIQRAGKSLSDLRNRCPKLEEWINGQSEPTYKQLEEFANAVYIPFGYLFLSEPFEDEIPIPDFRTIKDNSLNKISLNLIDTIHMCQSRQDWFREYAQRNNIKKNDFIRSVSIHDSIVAVADLISRKLKISFNDRQSVHSPSDLLRFLKSKIEEAGVLVMAYSMVGNSNQRKLDVKEFRGFALCDDYAPLIFINSRDSKTAQIFTLIHELAHLWLGESGISNPDFVSDSKANNENWCNMVAAEILIPSDILEKKVNKTDSIETTINNLEKIFYVSKLVILRRLKDTGMISNKEYNELYRKEMLKPIPIDRKTKGGDSFRNLQSRIGNKFLYSIMVDTLEGRTMYRDALRLTGISKIESFKNNAEKMGVL